MAQGPDRIVIRRPRKRHGGHHGGSWKIAYADFITALMAFFLVMWLVAITSIADRKGLAEYFQTPLKSVVTGGVDSGSTQSAIPIKGGDISPTQGDVRRAAASATRRLQQIEADRQDALRLEDLRKRLETLIERSSALREYRPQLLLDMTSEGLRIQIVDDQDRPMFRTGSSEVEPHMRRILREIGPVLNEMPNKISLTGHTDARPYASGERAYSNWELSADRANASRRELVAGGMDDSKVMRVIGLASSMNLVKDDPYADVNRRISLVVLNNATQRRIERENASAAEIRRYAIDEARALSQQQAEQGDGWSWLRAPIQEPSSAPDSDVSGFEEPGDDEYDADGASILDGPDRPFAPGS